MFYMGPWPNWEGIWFATKKLRDRSPSAPPIIINIMIYTIYKITNTVNNKIYIGKHQTNNINDKYLGSGKILKQAIDKYGINKFKKEILYEFDNVNEMNEMESKIVDEEFVKRKDTYNLKIGGEGEWDHIKGKLTVKDKNGNISNVSVNNPKYLSGNLIHVCKNTVSIKDKNGNNYRVSINDPQYLSGELIPVITGMKVHSQKFKDHIGKILSISQKGKGNSQYGTCWIYNLELKENKKIHKGKLQEWLDEGWIKGRKMNF